MTTKKIMGIIGVTSAAILVALVFVPTNEFSGIGSHNPDSPSPIMVYENRDDVLIGLKIIPVGCNKTDTGLNESEIQISNTSDNDYKVRVGISFTNNGAVLYEKEIDLTVLAGQTINQSQLSDKPYDNPVCVAQIEDWSKI